MYINDVTDEYMEVYSYAESPDGFHLSDTYYTVLESDISKKIAAPEFVKKSRSRWAYKFNMLTWI